MPGFGDSMNFKFHDTGLYVKDLFKDINDPNNDKYGNLIILFQVAPDHYYRGKFLPIKDKSVMYGTNNYELFKIALKQSVDDYVYNLIINQPLDSPMLGCYPIFDDLARKQAGKGGGKGYTFNIYVYPKNQYDSYKDIFKNGYHKHYDL